MKGSPCVVLQLRPSEPVSFLHWVVCCVRIFLPKGARHVLTMTAAREFALSLLLLVGATEEDAGGTILQRGVEIAAQTLEVSSRPGFWQRRAQAMPSLLALAKRRPGR